MNLKERSILLSEGIEDKRNDIISLMNDTLANLGNVTTELKIAAAQGDISENAEFKEAQKSLTSMQVSLSVNLGLKKNIESRPDESRYTSIGMITPYTTVLLRNQTYNTDMVIKLIPNGISDLSRSLVATNSPLGKKLLFKEIGDTVTMVHNQNGLPIKFEVVDIY